MLLGFPLHATTLLFQVQGFLHCYSPLRADLLPSSCVVVGVLLFIEESYTNPLHSFLQKLGVVGIQELKTCIFPVSIFPFAYFHFIFLSYVFCSFVFFFFLNFFGYGARFVLICFGNKYKPLYF